MQFDYQKRPVLTDPVAPWVIKPYLRITLSHNSSSVELDALIDSGADVSIFHASLAKALGLDVEAGLQQHFRGISGEPIPSYFHTLQLQVMGLSPIQVAVAFTDSPGVVALLGQADFFQAHQIKFERYKERIEINPAPKK
jgi:Aspartyl protease